MTTMRSIEAITPPAHVREPRVVADGAVTEASPPRLVFSKMYNALHPLLQRAQQPGHRGGRDRSSVPLPMIPFWICGEK